MKKSCKNILCTFFWAPIPKKRYQNTSDSNNDNNSSNNNNNNNKVLTK